MPIYYLSEQLVFPPVQEAEEGILAIGGDLSPERILLAYRSGIFPWYSANEPIIWWSPDPRFVLFPEELRVSRSMAQLRRSQRYKVTFDRDFQSVIRACAAVRRKGQDGTWITEDMLTAYHRLHQMGLAHSVEVWESGELIGGLYGVALGKVFFGESMFHRVSNMSKLALVHLVKALRARDFLLIDCQVPTEHLASLGARGISRDAFLDNLSEGLSQPAEKGSWSHWDQGTDD